MASVSNSANRGALIVFEGCDRCGKSTQSSLLVEYLKEKNISVKHLAFPDRTSHSGMLINSYLTNKQDLPDEIIHLLFTINRWEMQDEMKKLLLSGTSLVVDRYSYSGVAYTTSKGLSLDWCKAPEKGLIRPDRVFYLRTDIDTLSSRGQFGLERYEQKHFQRKVAVMFDELHKSEGIYWKQIDAGLDVETVHKSLQEDTLNVIDAVRHTGIPLLWQ